MAINVSWHCSIRKISIITFPHFTLSEINSKQMSALALTCCHCNNLLGGAKKSGDKCFCLHFCINFTASI